MSTSTVEFSQLSRIEEVKNKILKTLRTLSDTQSLTCTISTDLEIGGEFGRECYRRGMPIE
jgi:hypothetical protein